MNAGVFAPNSPPIYCIASVRFVALKITKLIITRLDGDIRNLDGYKAGGDFGKEDGIISSSEFKNFFKDELGSQYTENKDIFNKFFNFSFFRRSCVERNSNSCFIK